MDNRKSSSSPGTLGWRSGVNGEAMVSLSWLNCTALAAVAAATLLVVGGNRESTAGTRLLNVSYDPTRELYRELNARYAGDFPASSGPAPAIRQSHGGSSHQVREVAGGQLEADVVTLALPSDIETLRRRGLIAEGWAERLPNHSCPYTSTIIFVVRHGNPKGIHDWTDLVGAGVDVVTPNPASSGNGKLSIIAAWGSVIQRGGDDAAAAAFIARLIQHIVMLGDGARDASNSFALNDLGDVHLTWENEALREAAESGGKLEVVYPPLSIRAEPAVAWVDANVRRHQTMLQAEAYLRFLFSDAAQEIIAAHGYRPESQAILQRHHDALPDIQLFPITLLGRDWGDVQRRFFSENGLYDIAVDAAHAAQAGALGK
jgi:sulfate/thiosulfate transport system substrate-binding protein